MPKPRNPEAAAPTRRMLLPSISGISHRFGELQAGVPFDRDAAGAPLDPEEMVALAAQSEFLSVVEVPLESEAAPAETAAGE